MSTSSAEDPYELVSPLLKLAEDWLALSEVANVPLGLAVHELRLRGDWRLSIYRTPQAIEGVSVVMPRAHCYLEARLPLAAEMLCNMAVVHGRRPSTLTTTQQIADWVRPFLLETGGIGAERRISLLRCTQPPGGPEGRWATPDDLPGLRKYETKIDRDEKQYMDTSWEVLVALKELAVFSMDDSIVGSIRRYGPTPTYAGISDLFVLPEVRGTAIAAKLTGFATGELLAKRKSVYALVDENDRSTIALYRGMSFEDQGTLYRAYLA